jgi:hypothetical protein
MTHTLPIGPSRARLWFQLVVLRLRLVTNQQLMKKVDRIVLGPAAKYLWLVMRKKRYSLINPAGTHGNAPLILCFLILTIPAVAIPPSSVLVRPQCCVIALPFEALVAYGASKHVHRPA